MTAPIRSQSELLDAIRARRDELNISHETIDQIAGFQSGYTSKLLAPQPIKNLGPMSLGAILGALGMSLEAKADPEACEKVSGRWQTRKRPQRLVEQASRASIGDEHHETLEKQAKIAMSERMKQLSNLGASKGGKQRAKALSNRARKRAARHAARMRWAKK